MVKKEIRATYKQLRKELSEDDLAARSAAIFEWTQKSFKLEGKSISLFLPIERFLEINTWPFLNQIDANFYLPVITGENQLEHIKYENPGQIKVSDWGIPEPAYGERILAGQLDIVLVPLLAIDSRGYRVGYGKGFYDQFLANCSPDCQFIGLSYFDPIEPFDKNSGQRIDDLHEADIPIHFCVTPKGVIKF